MSDLGKYINQSVKLRLSVLRVYSWRRVFVSLVRLSRKQTEKKVVLQNVLPCVSTFYSVFNERVPTFIFISHLDIAVAL